MNHYCPVRGYEAPIGVPLEPVALAIARVLRRIHILPVPPDPTLLVQERNQIILARFEAGESQADLARLWHNLSAHPPNRPTQTPLKISWLDVNDTLHHTS
jgi:hypothetical protein